MQALITKMDPTPPASRNGFEYYNGDFYVVITSSNRHHRYTTSELSDLFNSPCPGSVKDKPAYWYRAQLLHYGTNNKGTAVMRLLDALRRGELEVPEYLRKLEGDLKREWKKNERERGNGRRKAMDRNLIRSWGI
jgi:hypothetical protein